MISLCIQAGGASTRMGSNKALLPFNGEPLIQRILRRLSPIADEVFIISNQPEAFTRFGMAVFPDAIEEVGALGGLYTALLRGSGDLVAMAACDMPFANSALLLHMLQQAQNPAIAAVIPKTNGYYEPTFAVYRREICLPLILNAIQTNQKRLISWFDNLDNPRIETVPETILAKLDPDHTAFINVNTPEEFAAAEHLAKISG